jgi:hypothetical protein
MRIKFVSFTTTLMVVSLLIFPTHASFDQWGSSTPDNPKDRVSKKAVVKEFLLDYRKFTHFCLEGYNLGMKKNEERPNSFVPATHSEVGESGKLLTNLISYLKKNPNVNYGPERVLSFLLKVRFEYVDHRKKMMNSFVARYKEAEENLVKGPIDGFCGFTSPDSPFCMLKENEFFARLSIDRYQFYNRSILRFWKLIEPRTLNAATKLQVRCSRMLWANFLGERDDLGLTDEAILNSPNSIHPFKRDAENYEIYLKPQFPIEVEFLGWAKRVKGQTININRTMYECSLWDETFNMYGKLEDAPYPEWLKPLPQYPSQTEISTIEQDLTEKVSETVLKKKEKARKPRKVKKYSENRADQNIIRQKPKSQPSSNEPEASARKIFPLLDERAIVTEDILRQPKEDLEAILDEARPDLIKHIDNVEKNKSEAIITTDVLDKPDDEEKENVLPDAKAPSSLRPRPRGMRMFHPNQTPPQQIELIQLKGKLEKVRQKIFDHQKFQKVSFGKFKTLWKHICGEHSVIESTGSSHVKLIGPRGEVFGVYAHGDGMTYGKKTIMYIRDALRQIGYGE